MIVSASTDCFPELGLPDVFERLADLEYSAVEIAIRHDHPQVTPEFVLQDVEKAINLCRDTHRLGITGYAVEISAKGDEHYEQFAAICKMAKATKVATLTVPSAELGTPFNEEVEHLRRLVSIATLESVVVSMRSQIGCLTEDPDTVVVLCDNVKGLRITLDPSHYICEPNTNRNFDKLMKYTQNVYLRDTSKSQLQVRVGQGEVDYGKLINLLRRVSYDRALCVHMQALPGVDHMAEMRKLRLLLESLT
ncbi:MAG: sugar phosphate isomerase/epimerase [Planctomycetales bacterium]|nr:sugar phosphate isomerase/epimerase [Planctomycetales bacterium]